ncbi:MAG: D-aminoacyl-tRNA deacylase [Balneolaceae bacterium]
MRIVIQRVKSASVTVNNEVSGSIDKGLLLFVGIHQTDTKEKADWCCRKILKLRIFEDSEGKMNKSLLDVGGELLVVSQFTLYGDMKKGTRPSFIEAGKPDMAEPLYDYMVKKLKGSSVKNVETGKFGAMMDVELVNDGPVTLIMER